MIFEIRLTKDMILNTAQGIANNSRIFEQYRFRNQWTKMLTQFALTDDGYLRDDWETRLREWGSKWRYNRELADMTDETVLNDSIVSGCYSITLHLL